MQRRSIYLQPRESFVSFFFFLLMPLAGRGRGDLIEREGVIIQFAGSAEPRICMQTRDTPPCFI
jgi:hypothetical protein